MWLSVFMGSSVLLAACGSGGSPASRSHPLRPRLPVGAQHPPAVRSASAPPANRSRLTDRCQTSQLAIQVVREGVAAGTAMKLYELTNHASASCTLFGYPEVQMLNTAGRVLTTTVHRAPVSSETAPARVTLFPGGHAWFWLQYPDGTGYGHATCPLSHVLEVTPPSARSYLLVTEPSGQIAPFGGTTSALRCGAVTVTAVAAQPSPG